MRVALLYNPKAGNGLVLDEIVESLGRHGHELVCLVDHKRDRARLLEAACDLVVAAGGDGTVAAVSRTIAHRGVPMAILPLGTANNIALTLGIDAPADDLIRGWTTARRQSFDLGTVRGSLGDRRFVEGVGVGLVPAGIAAATAEPPDQTRRALSNLARTVQLYRDALERLRPTDATLEVDSVRMSGTFLSIEVFNIPFVGPHLVLAPEANPSDGLLSLTYAGEDQRPQLDEYLRRRAEGIERPVALPSFHGRRIDLRVSGCVHVDDELYEGGHLSIHVEEAALTVLLPEPPEPR
jgi:diacylglycerol kinase family enzyme